MDRTISKVSFAGALWWHRWSPRCVAVLAAGSLVMALAAREASACSVQRTLELVGSPANGDVNVPTDVVPYYALPEVGGIPPLLLYPGLSWSEADAIATTIEYTYDNHVEVVPERPLEPNTEYRLLNECYVMAVTFTTGDGPFEGSPETPDASLAHYRFAEQPGAGTSPVGSCVAFESERPLVVTSVDELGQEHGPELREQPYFTNLSGIEQEPPLVCERLQSRAPNGILSEPVELCRDDGPLYTLGPDEDIECTPEGLTRAGAVVTEETNTEPDGEGGAGTHDGAAPDSRAAGCSLTGKGPHPRSTGLLGAGLLTLSWVARATRRRRPPKLEE